MSDQELPSSSAAERNKAPILEVLSRLLPERAKVLEIASGTGQHAAHCATERPGWSWQPTDAQAQQLAVIEARCASAANVLPPLQLDVLAAQWPPALGRFDAVVCVNMLHVSPWAACAALMQGAARHLAIGGALILYGPYRVDGEPTAASNLAFDADLRSRNPEWGLRRLDDVVGEAERAGLEFAERVDMPANNLMLVFRLAALAATHQNAG